MSTILVPLDGSALAEQVLPLVGALAPALDATVRLLEVDIGGESPGGPLRSHLGTVWQRLTVVFSPSVRPQASTIYASHSVLLRS